MKPASRLALVVCALAGASAPGARAEDELPPIFARTKAPGPAMTPLKPTRPPSSPGPLSDHLRSLLFVNLRPAIIAATRSPGLSAVAGTSGDISVMQPYVVKSTAVKEVKLAEPEKYTDHFLRTGNLFHLTPSIPVDLRPTPWAHQGITSGVPPAAQIAIRLPF
jgi:hypothetical protein